MGLNGVFDGSGGIVVAGLLMIVEKWKRIVGQQLRYFWFFFFSIVVVCGCGWCGNGGGGCCCCVGFY